MAGAEAAERAGYGRVLEQAPSAEALCLPLPWAGEAATPGAGAGEGDA